MNLNAQDVARHVQRERLARSPRYATSGHRPHARTTAVLRRLTHRFS